jgi:type III secretory pathway component EscS
MCRQELHIVGMACFCCVVVSKANDIVTAYFQNINHIQDDSCDK